jgi:hypothetical protein
LPDRRIGLPIIIPVFFGANIKRPETIVLAGGRVGSISTHFSCINLGRKLEIIAIK